MAFMCTTNGRHCSRSSKTTHNEYALTFINTCAAVLFLAPAAAALELLDFLLRTKRVLVADVAHTIMHTVSGIPGTLFVR